MAYAMLASLPPVHGLYTSLVPTVLYAVLGTSRHMSTGAFAITSLLLGQFVHKILLDQGYHDSSEPDGEYQSRYLPLCLLLTFIVGGIQIMLSMARMGRWISKHLLPIALVSGFNTASAFHIGTHQLKHWFGVKPPRESGVFGMLRTWIWIIQHFWKDTIWPSLAMGLLAMTLMYVLQRIEHCRRSRSRLTVELSSSMSPPPSPSTSPALPSQCCMDPVHKTNHHQHNDRREDQLRKNIVPSAVSDQSLLTVQDVDLENTDQEDDDSSPGWSPISTPTPNSEQSMLPTLQLPTSYTHLSTRNQRMFVRPAVNTMATAQAGPSQPQIHSPTSLGVAGLTNTGAFGHRQELRRVPNSAPAARVRRYKSFRPPTSLGSNRPRSLIEYSDEQEPLLSRNRSVIPPSSSRRDSISSVSTTSDVEEDGSNSSTSSVVDTAGCGSQPCSQEQEMRTGSWQGRILENWLPQWVPRVHFPIPDIFICVVVFTAATVLFNLDKRYHIEVIGAIPTGLPTATWPPTMLGYRSVHDWVPLLWPGFLMAIIVYVMSLSVAKHFGREYGYEIDADQEMLALGVGSLAGSCFGGYTCTGNLTRSAILAQLGAKTPLASLVGALMVMLSLLWLTVLFERVPNTILAAIVLVSLRSLIAHTFEAKRLWRIGRRKEAIIWWITFISVMLFSIEIGLAVGMATVVVFKLYKHGPRWKRAMARSIKQSATYQRLMLMLGLQSPLFTMSGRGLYTGDDEDDY
ncbi:hypothetical protein BG011_005288 [Mortierella polycephala]|uniref:SLC26A/SulP transporter domain-containing protein n=1 Tax=Mortierella polycephala TaxID=41804 RepID=A0A9P6PZI6_9FUNG|nr:hypothetical protein BG011_005288 [Mortierella polycephala]